MSDIITFDCYGTLIDWREGISRAFVDRARVDGIELEPAAVLRAYHEIEPAIQARGYRPYRAILEDVARESARWLSWDLAPERACFLPDSLASWRPFPDTNPALERLRAAGIRLGILSNVDDDLLAGTLGQFTVEFDLIVTAEQVRSYKPAPPHFERARAAVGDARWLHAAQSYFHDVEPAVALGIPVAWVNRLRETERGATRPEIEIRTLMELVEVLEM